MPKMMLDFFFLNCLRERQHAPADTRGNKNNLGALFLTHRQIVMFYTSLENLAPINLFDFIHWINKKNSSSGFIPTLK